MREAANKADRRVLCTEAAAFIVLKRIWWKGRWTRRYCCFSGEHSALMAARNLQMVKLDVITVNHSEPRPHVILSNDERTLSIDVGVAEAQAIDAALKNESHSRPMTHDLICNLLIGLRGLLQSMTIYKFEDNTFLAHMNLEHVSEEGQLEQVVRIDCRPSDGIVIALRSKSPIYVTEEVLAAADQEQALRDNGDVKADDFED